MTGSTGRPTGRPRLDPKRPKVRGINIYLKDDQRAKLQKLARNRNTTPSAIVRAWLDHTVDDGVESCSATLRYARSLRMLV